MLITHEREKLINAIKYFVKNTKYCGLTKLFKLLYFLDFIHFRETGKPVTGLTYYTWKMGPVPRDLYNEIKDQKGNIHTFFLIQNPEDLEAEEHESLDYKIPNDLREAGYSSDPRWGKNKKKTTVFKAYNKYHDKYFSKREKRILEEVAFMFKELWADQIVEVTHLKGAPWDKTKKQNGMDQPIDYMLALDGSSDKELNIEELKTRIVEMEIARTALE